MTILTTPSNQHSRLYTVRLWLEELEHGQSEIRGEVRHVVSGEVRYFRRGGEMLRYLVDEGWDGAWVEGWVG